ncbi:hypothetical protein [Polyangium sorediatum]|uniref:Uncharacterized protein n=1 Tax=Polyangium sorediatum TaxID=889274 RepID=A0ABT6NXS9_9BACT|nr:hypothetical protein [Polyangium sorediatum]MDI1433129.1 hypothetical protein [Polyangium sorediatum]
MRRSVPERPAYAGSAAPRGAGERVATGAARFAISSSDAARAVNVDC